MYKHPLKTGSLTMNKFRSVVLDNRFVAICWFAVTLAAPFKHIFLSGIHNNYLIFKYVFYHSLEQTNLYAPSPHYWDTNHYGPLFGMVIAPFALLPDRLGCLLWAVGISLSLFVAIRYLPVKRTYRIAIYYILMNELFTNIVNMQTNPLIAALIVGSLVALMKEREAWAAGMIMLGCFIKIYSIAGLCLFFVSRHRLRLAGYLVLWSVVFFVLPMLLSSATFVVQSYADWYHSLVGKNVENAMSIYQDISVMGMVRRISGNRHLHNIVFLLPAIAVFAMQYIRVEMYDNVRYRLAMLASALLFVTLFSSGSESPTYIIAMTGVAIWFLLQKRPRGKMATGLFVLALALTGFSTTDFVPGAVRVFTREYALKALPCLIVWLTLAYQVIVSGAGFLNDRK
jgi:hypothetical protein